MVTLFRLLFALLRTPGCVGLFLKVIYIVFRTQANEQRKRSKLLQLQFFLANKRKSFIVEILRQNPEGKRLGQTVVHRLQMQLCRGFAGI